MSSGILMGVGIILLITLADTAVSVFGDIKDAEQEQRKKENRPGRRRKKHKKGQKDNHSITATYMPMAVVCFIMEAVIVCVFIFAGTIAVQAGDSPLPFIGTVLAFSAFFLGTGIPSALWKLELTDDGIEYRDWLGRHHHYAYSDVTGCRITRWNDYVFYHGDQKLFAVAGQMRQVIDRLIRTKQIPVIENRARQDTKDAEHAVRPQLGGEIAIGVGAALFLGCLIVCMTEGWWNLAIPSGILFLLMFLAFLAQLLDKTWIEDQTVCQRKLFRKTKRIRYTEIGRIAVEMDAANEPLIVLYGRDNKKLMRVYVRYRNVFRFEEELEKHIITG